MRRKLRRVESGSDRCGSYSSLPLHAQYSRYPFYHWRTTFPIFHERRPGSYAIYASESAREIMSKPSSLKGLILLLNFSANNLQRFP